MPISETHQRGKLSSQDIEDLATEFEPGPPESVLRWATEEFGSGVALATGFGPEGCVLIDMLAQLGQQTRIFYLDTDLHFAETFSLVRRLEMRYGVSFERRATHLTLTAQEQEFGAKLWERDPDRCCQLRKVDPLVETLANLQAWITAIRREQSPARAVARMIECDPKFGLIKINPLVRWSVIKVWKYIFKHNVPYNELHDKGYPSIGCIPCTTQVLQGEDPRAGRWRGVMKTECGLHQ
jgi:phosphoadenosine phosphosulfate reductase